MLRESSKNHWIGSERSKEWFDEDDKFSGPSDETTDCSSGGSWRRAGGGGFQPVGNVLVNQEGDGSGWSDSQQTRQEAFIKASRPFKPRRVQERAVVTPSTLHRRHTRNTNSGQPSGIGTSIPERIPFMLTKWLLLLMQNNNNFKKLVNLWRVGDSFTFSLVSEVRIAIENRQRIANLQST